MSRFLSPALVVLTGAVLLLASGCSQTTAPVSTTNSGSRSSAAVGLTSASTVVGQDLTQLFAAGVTTTASRGIFSIGWHQFVGPNIVTAGTIGEAFAVVRSDTSGTTRPDGMDIGAVTLTYTGGSAELAKQTTPSGGVMYSTFDKGLRHPETLPVNIPFVSNSVYLFTVTGSTGFTAGTFAITAPASLLKITSPANGDSASTSGDLTLLWTGGSASDSVLVRIVPHLRPEQVDSCDRGTPIGPRGPGDSLAGPHGPGDGMGGRGGHGPGDHRRPDASQDGPGGAMGPGFENRLMMKVPNTGSLTVTAADLQTLVGNTSAGELMVGVAQVIKQDVLHDGNTLTLLLRNGDSVVLKLR